MKFIGEYIFRNFEQERSGVDLQLIDKVFGNESSSLSKIVVKPIVKATYHIASVIKYYYLEPKFYCVRISHHIFKIL